MERVVCFGDSITHGASYAEGTRWTSRLAARLEAWRPGGYEVHNCGIGGNTTHNALERANEALIPLLPATTLIEFGINDGNVRDWLQVPRVNLSNFEDNLREIIRLVRDGGGAPILIVNHLLSPASPVQGNGKRFSENVQPYNDVIRQVASAESLPTIDLPQMMGKWALDPDKYLIEDGVHLNDRGNAEYAEIVFKRFCEIVG